MADRSEAPVCRPADVDRTTIYEKSSPGRRAYTLPELGVPEVSAAELVPESLRRSSPARLPEISEIDLLRHFTGLSTLNYGVDSGSYPLGSCTMKYNPRVNEAVARLDGFAGLHPYQPESLVQGALELMYELERWLAEISGLHVTTLQPAAGAHGELTGLLVIRAAHLAEGRDPRRIIIPDTAHGTNPASVVTGGFVPAPVRSDARGGVDMDHLRVVIAEGDIAGLMLTNPNTLGLFDEHIAEIAQLVHEAGGLLYYDGANINAVLGIAGPATWASTSSTSTRTRRSHAARRRRPRRRSRRRPRLAGAVLARAPGGEGGGRALLLPVRPSAVHRQGPHVLRQLRHAGAGLDVHPQPRRQGTAKGQRAAVLNANYVMEGVRGLLDLPFGDRRCMHEFVGSAAPLKQDGCARWM